METNDILTRLNKEQQEAVLQTEGPVLILAGAGSGKTRVLVHRIAYLINVCGVDPYSILAITFTNKAADEMRSRVDDMIGFGSREIWVMTFHACCVRILRRHAEEAGYTRYFTIYDTDDQMSVMKDIFKRRGIDTKFLKERTALGMISNAKNELVGPDEYARMTKGDYMTGQVADIYDEYQKRLRENNAMDFDDLIMNTVLLFEQHPEILDLYRERFRYMMVDEYQDTNTAQFRFVSLLAGKYKNLCVVGDDDQRAAKASASGPRTGPAVVCALSGSRARMRRQSSLPPRLADGCEAVSAAIRTSRSSIGQTRSPASLKKNACSSMCPTSWSAE